MNDPYMSMMVNDELMMMKGKTRKERAINEARHAFEVQVKGNPGYTEDALRNGKAQPVLVTKTDFFYKATITAFPGDEIYAGDIFDFYGKKWIVTETKSTNVIQKVGVAWQCNHKFRFQNFTEDIHEAWGVLDDGVYSTTRTSDSTIMTMDMQYKIFLPENEFTNLIYEDQRIATDRWIDKNGNKTLMTYAITGRNRVTDNYDDGDHLLILNARQTSYEPEKDNYDEMICDYISSDNRSELPNCVIEGRNYIRVGSRRTYKVGSAHCGDENLPLNIRPVWRLESAPGIEMNEVGSTVVIDVPDDLSYQGEIIRLTLADENGKYAPGSLEIEVTV